MPSPRIAGRLASQTCGADPFLVSVNTPRPWIQGRTAPGGSFSLHICGRVSRAAPLPPDSADARFRPAGTISRAFAGTCRCGTPQRGVEHAHVEIAQDVVEIIACNAAGGSNGRKL